MDDESRSARETPGSAGPGLQWARQQVGSAAVPALLVDGGGVVLAANELLERLVDRPDGPGGGSDLQGQRLDRLGLRVQPLGPDAGGGGPAAVQLDGTGAGGRSWRLDGVAVEVPGEGPVARVLLLDEPARDADGGAAGPGVGDLLHLLVDNAVDYAIFTVDPGGYVSSWNPGAERINGYRPEEIIGRHFSVFYTPEDIARRHPEFELRVAEQEGRYSEDGWRVRQDGTRIWASVTLVPLRGPDGRLFGFGKVTRDLTAELQTQQALRVSEQRFRGLVENMTDAYVVAERRPAAGDGDPVTGPDRPGWRISYAGGGFSRVFGLDPEAVVADRVRIEDLAHPQDAERVRAQWSEPTSSGPHASDPEPKDGGELQFRLLRAGQDRWIRARYRWLAPDPDPDHAPEPDGGQDVRLACIFEDVTQAKVDQVELQRAQREAQAANLAKSEFLSRMSHELRTPLNAVLGFAQLLELGDSAPETLEAAGHIRRSGKHLLDLINEVLDISRIESGQLTLSTEQLDLLELCQEVQDLMRPLAAAADVTLDLAVDASGWALGDRQRVRQILWNLMSNAVKYNRPGGRVTTAITVADRTTQLCVRDSGPGIAADLMPRLFQPFDRLGAESSAVEGSGVGLALSRGLAEAMGGTLTATSQPGVGSTFTLQLPAAEPPARRGLAPDAAVAQPAQGAGRPLRLVYVEDNTPNVHLMEAALRLRPRWQAVHAPTAGLAVDLITADPPDLVLLDLHLPDDSGEAVLAKLHARPSTALIPVIVVSADATPGRIARLRAAGVRDYLAKPLVITELLAAIDERAREVDAMTNA